MKGLFGDITKPFESIAQVKDAYIISLSLCGLRKGVGSLRSCFSLLGTILITDRPQCQGKYLECD